MELHLRGKKALVMSSSRGLGAGIASELAAEGVDVLLTGRNVTQLQKLTDKINAADGGRAEYETADLAKPEAVEILAKVRSALVGWSKSLSNDLAGQGITVNMLVPGRIHTERIDELDEAAAKRSGKTIDEVRLASRSTIPTGRYGTVNEFAAAATFLCSEPAGYITGSVVPCDGGMIKSV